MTINQDRYRGAALEQYVLPELDLLLRVALALTRNHADAEDLVQDTLLRAYRSIDRFDGQHPRAWLLTILRRAHINRNRRQRPTLLADQEAALRQLAATSDSDDPERLVVDDRLDGALPRRFTPYRSVFARWWSSWTSMDSVTRRPPQCHRFRLGP